ncbi:DUF397 domain-containing protein [Streptomyces sp. SBC-4]|nr:DUF397 domain-containing protein [Streptomyces sp. SBC-4]MDV5147560.1 DUF397 domain-containing protein [Streptomyces sp. SBC-4]
MSNDLNWFKSSYSGPQGGDCIEVAVTWVKSSYSGGQGGDCVEVASCVASIHVRDSKDLAVPSFEVSPGAWSAFLASVGE